LAAPPESGSFLRRAGDRIAVPYNHRLKRLEALLAGVEWTGDFFVQGSLDAPIPRVEINGVGVLSFSVPASQIEVVIKRAHRAPYGRGEQRFSRDRSATPGSSIAPMSDRRQSLGKDLQPDEALVHGR